ncbi:Uncharacterised protein [Mannheimia haemolytica]|uniref:Uncharacterized protein n=1 Tax=Mannheimia haemolytica TaxID=75985 RepID=A0A3S4XDJ3_MANHA|nr:hypothetical protein [Mannheimia haemolytica]VEI77981.1 Uncharacterised protein [Mannheimia haemolytica]
MTVRTWDSDYPQDLELPPQDAIEFNKEAYRMVSKETPDMSDFLASFKDSKQKNYTHCKGRPEFYATSFFNSLDKAKEMLVLRPNAFRGKFIAVGTIRPEHGKGIENHMSGHISMWFYQGVYPEGFVRA